MQSPVQGFAKEQDKIKKQEAQRIVERDLIQKQILETLTTISNQLAEILELLKQH